jgi:hypothetical protein
MNEAEWRVSDDAWAMCEVDTKVASTAYTCQPRPSYSG